MAKERQKAHIILMVSKIKPDSGVFGRTWPYLAISGYFGTPLGPHASWVPPASLPRPPAADDTHAHSGWQGGGKAVSRAQVPE